MEMTHRIARAALEGLVLTAFFGLIILVII